MEIYIRIESSKIDSHIYGKEICNKGAKATQLGGRKYPIMLNSYKTSARKQRRKSLLDLGKGFLSGTQKA